MLTAIASKKKEGTANLRVYLKMSEFFLQNIPKLTYNWVLKEIDCKFNKNPKIPIPRP